VLERHLKVGIHSYFAWRSTFKEMVCSKPASSLVSLSQSLTGYRHAHICVVKNGAAGLERPYWIKLDR